MILIYILGTLVSFCRGTPVTLCSHQDGSELTLMEGHAFLWEAQNPAHFQAPDFVFLQTHKKRLTFVCRATHPLYPGHPNWHPRIHFQSEHYNIAELPYENQTTQARVMTMPENFSSGKREMVACENVCNVDLVLMPPGHPLIKCLDSEDSVSIDCHVELKKFDTSRSLSWYMHKCKQ